MMMTKLIESLKLIEGGCVPAWYDILSSDEFNIWAREFGFILNSDLPRSGTLQTMWDNAIKSIKDVFDDMIESAYMTQASRPEQNQANLYEIIVQADRALRHWKWFEINV